MVRIQRPLSIQKDADIFNDYNTIRIDPSKLENTGNYEVLNQHTEKIEVMSMNKTSPDEITLTSQDVEMPTMWCKSDETRWHAIGKIDTQTEADITAAVDAFVAGDEYGSYGDLLIHKDTLYLDMTSVEYMASHPKIIPIAIRNLAGDAIVMNEETNIKSNAKHKHAWTKSEILMQLSGKHGKKIIWVKLNRLIHILLYTGTVIDKNTLLKITRNQEIITEVVHTHSEGVAYHISSNLHDVRKPYLELSDKTLDMLMTQEFGFMIRSLKFYSTGPDVKVDQDELKMLTKTTSDTKECFEIITKSMDIINMIPRT